jgi:hypothetical protein
MRDVYGNWQGGSGFPSSFPDGWFMLIILLVASLVLGPLLKETQAETATGQPLTAEEREDLEIRKRSNERYHQALAMKRELEWLEEEEKRRSI